MAHILLVEDSTLVVDALRLLFESAGHRVTVAGTVAATIDAVRRDQPDVMLLDLGLPDGDGLDALEHLNAEGVALPATFALTGTESVEVDKRCAAAGCRETLVKPVSPRVLLAKIDSVTSSSTTT